MKQKHPTGPSLKASPVVKRSIKIAGYQTSVSLEDEFWNALKEIATTQNVGISKTDVDHRQPATKQQQSIVGDPPVRSQLLS
jgi:predicted DNA-binding ribbon-helix-helix protein